MNKRNKYLMGASLAISGGALVAGALVTSNAMASGGISSKAVIDVISLSSDGGQPFSCHYEGVELTASLLPSIDAVDVVGIPGGVDGPGVIAGSVGVGGPVGVQAPEGAVTFSYSVSAMPGEGAPESGQAVIVSNTATAIADDATNVVTVGSDDVREGSEAESAALRP